MNQYAYKLFGVNRCHEINWTKMRAIELFLFALLIAGISGCEGQQGNGKALNVSLVGDNKLKIENPDSQRFQIATNPTVVIDTLTGQAWRLTGPFGGTYHFAQICYRSPNGNELMPIPYEDRFTQDLSKFRSECNQK